MRIVLDDQQHQIAFDDRFAIIGNVFAHGAWQSANRRRCALKSAGCSAFGPL